jgi:hypothetical protein
VSHAGAIGETLSERISKGGGDRKKEVDGLGPVAAAVKSRG